MLLIGGGEGCVGCAVQTGDPIVPEYYVIITLEGTHRHLLEFSGSYWQFRGPRGREEERSRNRGKGLKTIVSSAQRSGGGAPIIIDSS